MNGHDRYDELLRAARQDVPPPLDVTASVLETVRTTRARFFEPAERAPRLAAAVAAVLALLTLLPALQSFWSLTNPMTALFGAFRAAL